MRNKYLDKKTFNSIEELLNYDETTSHPLNSSFLDHELHPFDNEFFGTENLEELKRICKEGWPEGLRQVEKIKEELSVDLPFQGDHQKKRRRKFGAEGDDISLDRFYAGNFDQCWEGKEIYITQGKGRYVNFFVSIGTNVKIKPSQYFFTGATCIILADILEDSGLRVKITGFAHTKTSFKSGEGLYAELPIKDYDMPLNKERLTVCTAFAGFFRFYFLSWIRSYPKEVNVGYGYPISYPLNKKNDDIVIADIHNKQTALRFIRNCIDNLCPKNVL